MQSSDLLEAIARVEKAVADHPGPGSSPEEIWARHLEVSIQVLDSEYMNHADGMLELALSDYLQRKRLELGLPPEFTNGEPS